MAPIDRIKKKNNTTISIALMKMKPMSHDKAQMDAMSNPQSDMNMSMQNDTNNTDATPTKNTTPRNATPTDTNQNDTQSGTNTTNTGPETQGALAVELQDLLDNVSEYYITAHQFHWNVVGPDFAEFHKFFNKIYNDAWNSLDGLAENIRKLDQMVDIQFGQPDQCNNVQEMLGCLSDMNTALIDQYKNTIDCADKYREQGILNFLADRLDTHQMFQWQISSFLKSA